MEGPSIINSTSTSGGSGDFSFKRPANVMAANFNTVPNGGASIHRPSPALTPDSSSLYCFNKNNNSNGGVGWGASMDEGGGSTTTMIVDRPASCGALALWHGEQDDDFAGEPFDGSLSCLSDLAAPGYANDVLEFVKRQAAGQSASAEYGGRFEYILMTPTSAAVKLHEEPLTYLNQGQSYELKCKKLTGRDDDQETDQKMNRGRLVKSVIRITFHDRRQKFQELELLNEWKKMHNDEKIIDTDAPPSYGILNMKTDPMGTTLEFYWDTAKSTSIFIKVNCISTEFTARKRGGEKGVPFRLQVDTYNYTAADGVVAKKIHCSYALVKVFKTKGADRKNKGDREKAEKHGAVKEKYHPAYEFTVLTEAPPVDALFDLDQLAANQLVRNGGALAGDASSPENRPAAQASPDLKNASGKRAISPSSSPSSGSSDCSYHHKRGMANSDDSPFTPPAKNGKFSYNQDTTHHQPLHVDATPDETIDWLRCHRFAEYLKAFSNFSGADLLRLHRDDLIQICGTSQGIRLFNALQQKKLHPKLTLYICTPDTPTFHCVFLCSLTVEELVGKLCGLLVGTNPSQVIDTYCQGPGGINVHVTDEVVQNLPDRSLYYIEQMKCGDEQSDSYRFLLKMPGW